jgi:small subunit ribosomal protein S18
MNSMNEENNDESIDNQEEDEPEQITSDNGDVGIDKESNEDDIKDQKRKSYDERSSRGGDYKTQVQRVPTFKRKSCRFCFHPDLIIDYKQVDILERFITERGKILPRRITGTCSKHQRDLANAIKRARILALLPFVVK